VLPDGILAEPNIFGKQNIKIVGKNLESPKIKLTNYMIRSRTLHVIDDIPIIVGVPRKFADEGWPLTMPLAL
jgi:hypothetical protein